MNNKSNFNWIAGILDKGCGITASPNKKRFCIRVVMSSTNPEVAMKLHSLIGTGHIKIQNRKWTIKHHERTAKSHIKDCYRYMLFGTNAANFLKKVLPYLRTEKAQQKATLALQLHSDHSKNTLYKLKKLGTRTK